MHSVINQEVFVHTHFLCILLTVPEVIFPKHPVINEASDLQKRLLRPQAKLNRKSAILN